MNCFDFEKVVMDVAQSETRGVWMEAAVKQQALAHAQNCAHCATCLASEKSLSQGLRAVAVGDSSLGAPAGLEASLLAAFRARQAVELAPVVVREVVTSPFKLFFYRMRWAFAAAAAVTLIAFAVSRAMQPQPAQEREIVNHVPTPAPTVVVTPPAVEQLELPTPPDVVAPKANVLVRSGKQDRRPTQVTAKWPNREREGRVTVDVGEFVVDEPESLSANDFLVFDYARNLPPADSTQLMRVRMPRATLAPLGIQLPREARNSEFVNADFLVGSDGVPRAIRVANR